MGKRTWLCGTALALILAGPARPASAEWFLDLYGGGSFTQDVDVTIREWRHAGRPGRVRHRAGRRRARRVLAHGDRDSVAGRRRGRVVLRPGCHGDRRQGKPGGSPDLGPADASAAPLHRRGHPHGPPPALHRRADPACSSRGWRWTRPCSASGCSAETAELGVDLRRWSHVHADDATSVCSGRGATRIFTVDPGSRGPEFDIETFQAIGGVTLRF